MKIQTNQSEAGCKRHKTLAKIVAGTTVTLACLGVTFDCFRGHQQSLLGKYLGGAPDPTAFNHYQESTNRTSRLNELREYNNTHINWLKKQGIPDSIIESSIANVSTYLENNSHGSEVYASEYASAHRDEINAYNDFLSKCNKFSWLAICYPLAIISSLYTMSQIDKLKIKEMKK